MNTWSDYPILLAVAETGSLTAAGQKLGISQPTAGRRLRALEDALGNALVKKRDGQLVPTEFGETVLSHVRAMNEAASAIQMASVQQEDRLSGTVRISASQGMGDFWLPAAMVEFRELYPEINIDINVDMRMANLAQREADIALRWITPGTQNSVIGRKVVTCGFGLYASTSYLEAHGTPKSLDDLRDHLGSVVMTDGEELMWKYSGLGGERSPMRPVFVTDSVSAHITALCSGYGIGIVAHAAVCDIRDLVPVLPEAHSSADLWVVAHEELRKSPRMRAAFDYLVDALRRDEPHIARGEPTVFPDHQAARIPSSRRPPLAAE